MKYVKLALIGLIVLIVIIGYGYFFLCAGGESQADPVVVVDDWTEPLVESGYEPATGDDPSSITGDTIPDAAEPILYADGTVQDSVVVEVSVLETPEGEVWIKATVGGERVKIRTFEWGTQPARNNNDWSMLVAGEWIDGVDVGIGLAWEPLELYGSRIGLQAVVDINRDLGDAPDWVTPAVRVSRRWGAFSVGGYGGFRFGESAGIATGVNVGIAIAIGI